MLFSGVNVFKWCKYALKCCKYALKWCKYALKCVNMLDACKYAWWGLNRDLHHFKAHRGIMFCHQAGKIFLSPLK